MAQLNWTYVSDSGRQHLVGLFHGDRTGHLLVHCNSRIVLIDFHVLESKNYSFFIEDELCEIKLQREAEGYSYGFEINKEVDTPKNRERRATEKRHLWKGALLLLALILFVSFVWLGLRYRQHDASEQQLTVLSDDEAQESIAKIFLEADDAPSTLRYSFVADGRVVEGNSPLQAALLPLESGDEFVVRYADGRPDVHEIDFKQPSQRQLDRYRRRARERHQTLHPKLGSDRIECVIDVLFEAGGAAAYADIYYQDYSYAENPLHNRRTYRRLIGTPAIAEQLWRECRSTGE